MEVTKWTAALWTIYAQHLHYFLMALVVVTWIVNCASMTLTIQWQDWGGTDCWAEEAQIAKSNCHKKKKLSLLSVISNGCFPPHLLLYFWYCTWNFTLLHYKTMLSLASFWLVSHSSTKNLFIASISEYHLCIHIWYCHEDHLHSVAPSDSDSLPEIIIQHYTTSTRVKASVLGNHCLLG